MKRRYRILAVLATNVLVGKNVFSVRCSWNLPPLAVNHPALYDGIGLFLPQGENGFAPVKVRSNDEQLK